MLALQGTVPRGTLNFETGPDERGPALPPHLDQILDEIAQTLGAAPLSDEARTRLEPVLVAAVDTWRLEEEARAFLLRPHMLLDDATPFALASASPKGAERVLRILGRLKYGTAS